MTTPTTPRSADPDLDAILAGITHRTHRASATKDLHVLRVPNHLTDEARAHLRARWTEYVGPDGPRLLVLDGGVDLQVIRGAAADLPARPLVSVFHRPRGHPTAGVGERVGSWPGRRGMACGWAFARLGRYLDNMGGRVQGGGV